MCITNGPARLAKTRLLAVAGINGTQLTVYQNNARSETKNAMILPVPTTNGLSLIDMTQYKDIFSQLSTYFPKLKFTRSAHSKNTLKVHYVGSYQASIVNSLADFDRLDTSFRLNPTVKNILETHYPHFGFIVCQLLEGKNDYEPFAYTHQIVGDKVFIPTRHYHGEGSPEIFSDWDHEIYSVGCCAPDARHTTQESPEIENLCAHAGIKNQDSLLSKIGIHGYYKNYDVVLYAKPDTEKLDALFTDRYLTFTGFDGCKFYSNVEGLTFDRNELSTSTILLYRGKPLQVSRFSTPGKSLELVGQLVLCYDLGDGFLIQGLVSGNTWTYAKEQSSEMVVLNA